jgi:hypothetical protein
MDRAGALRTFVSIVLVLARRYVAAEVTAGSVRD